MHWQANLCWRSTKGSIGQSMTWLVKEEKRSVINQLKCYSVYIVHSFQMVSGYRFAMWHLLVKSLWSLCWWEWSAQMLREFFFLLFLMFLSDASSACPYLYWGSLEKKNFVWPFARCFWLFYGFQLTLPLLVGWFVGLCFCSECVFCATMHGATPLAGLKKCMCACTCA